MKSNKIINRIIAVSLLSIAYSACDESRLDVVPSSPTEEAYFKEELEFERGILGVYAKMNGFFSWNGGQEITNDPSVAIWQLPGDDATSVGTGSTSLDFENFNSLQPGNSIVKNYYANSYQVIARANVMLEKIAGVADGIYVTPNLKEYHNGEALFLRGYAHFGLWNFFGIAPVVTKRISTTDDTFAEPSEGNALLDQAIADFQAAAALLPASWPDTDRGRVTRNAAYGMLGKALLFRGTVTDSDADFTAAIAAFNNISGASLVEDFGDNFAADTENNAESLFEYQASRSPEENIWLPEEFSNVNGSMSVCSWVPFTNTNNWGYGNAPFIATTKLLNAFEPGDPRLALTMDPTSRTILKYTQRDQTVLGGASSTNNPRILRYADVLLMKAEAILRSGGSKSEAIGLINEVRTRARNMDDTGIPANRNTAETNDSVVMDWIMSERFVELAFEEGSRWFDLRRWHMAEEITLNNAFFASDNTGFEFNADKHLYFPIPQVEMDRNIKMRQNAGY